MIMIAINQQANSKIQLHKIDCIAMMAVINKINPEPQLYNKMDCIIMMKVIKQKNTQPQLYNGSCPADKQRAQIAQVGLNNHNGFYSSDKPKAPTV